ncbi:MAG TPA: c-type cytochrome domain-containing protein, partial [Verrucomicrobium sp.]|nr:c-type cytochrome domain-containing protein [Verrucomicrobium sp.]
MHRSRWRLAPFAPLLLASSITMAEATVDFTRDVQPLLKEHCLSCHGPDKQRGGFRLDSRAA